MGTDTISQSSRRPGLIARAFAGGSIETGIQPGAPAQPGALVHVTAVHSIDDVGAADRRSPCGSSKLTFALALR